MVEQKTGLRALELERYEYGGFLKCGFPQIIHLNGLFIINHPFWGTTIYGNLHIHWNFWEMSCCSQMVFRNGSSTHHGNHFQNAAKGPLSDPNLLGWLGMARHLEHPGTKEVFLVNSFVPWFHQYFLGQLIVAESQDHCLIWVWVKHGQTYYQHRQHRQHPISWVFVCPKTGKIYQDMSILWVHWYDSFWSLSVCKFIFFSFPEVIITSIPVASHVTQYTKREV